MRELRFKNLTKSFVLLCIAPFLLYFITGFGDYGSKECHRNTWDHIRPENLLASHLVPVNNFSIACHQKWGNRTSFLFLVHSFVHNTDKRRVIRRYATPMKSMRLIFVLGQLGDGLPQTVIEEMEMHGDIIVGPFLDSYSNLTYKHVFGLKWGLKHCPKVDFVVKMDDDIVANFRAIESLVDETYPVTNDALISRTAYKLFAGYIFHEMSVIRHPDNKWCTKRNEFQAHAYPDFCSGWGYITTAETIDSILRELQNISSGFWIDDVFITGSLRVASDDIFLDPLNDRYSMDERTLKDWALGNQPCSWDKLFSSSGNVEVQDQAYSRIASQESEWLPCSHEKNESLIGKSQVREIRMSRFR